MSDPIPEPTKEEIKKWSSKAKVLVNEDIARFKDEQNIIIDKFGDHKRTALMMLIVITLVGITGYFTHDLVVSTPTKTTIKVEHPVTPITLSSGSLVTQPIVTKRLIYVPREKIVVVETIPTIVKHVVIETPVVKPVENLPIATPVVKPDEENSKAVSEFEIKMQEFERKFK